MEIIQAENTTRKQSELPSIEIGIITDWWQELDRHPIEKQFLRSCRAPEQAYASEAAHQLHKRLPAHDRMSVYTLAALLANVDENDPETRFICKLAARIGRPAYSELHFTRLKACKSLHELFYRFRRAILLLKRSVQIESLAECTLHWADAHHPVRDTKPDIGELLERMWEREFRRL